MLLVKSQDLSTNSVLPFYATARHFLFNKLCSLLAELPPRPLLEKLAKELRHRLVNSFHLAYAIFSSFLSIWFNRNLCCTFIQGLQLFNLDIIREYGTRDNFYVIDINYFPGELWFIFALPWSRTMPKKLICMLWYLQVTVRCQSMSIYSRTSYWALYRGKKYNNHLTTWCQSSWNL